MSERKVERINSLIPKVESRYLIAIITYRAETKPKTNRALQMIGRVEIKT